MKCPKCGSNKIQFGTNTHGSGFSLFDACCGYAFLGPFGLLCGACGSGTSTKEFWICQDCGHKFSNDAAKRNKAKSENLYASYKSEVNYVWQKYGSKEKLLEAVDESSAKSKEADEKYNAAYSEFINEISKTNKKILKTAKIAKGYSNAVAYIIGSIILLGLILSFEGIGIPLLVIGILAAIFVEIRTYSAKRKIRRLFTEHSEENIKLLSEKETCKKEYEELVSLKEKVEYCENFEKENSN